ncbi:MAG TPA: choice-of-anchor Q domain-containing protein [Gemmatimonadales bacterium]|nr:choice-of-anchor Q domain-containing protein [Gemmatimonadales bacterium]
MPCLRLSLAPMARRNLVLLPVIFGLSLAPLATAATTHTVTKTADTADGTCDADCSLREAISAANAGAGGDTIDIPAGTYGITIAGTGEDSAATGDFDISKSVTIVGAGAGSTTISGNGLDRVFDIDPLGAGGVIVSISGVTITGGGADYTHGGGIQNGGTLSISSSVITGNTAAWNHGGGNAGHGGGILNAGALLISNSTISNNSDVVAGGGIYSAGAITVNNCTFSGNETQGTGGALYHTTATAAVVTNSTISNNRAWYIGANTGGIFNDGGTLTITNSTITGNRIEGAWWSTNAGLGNNTGTTYVSNTIVANQGAGTDCWNYTGGGGGPIISNGHNLESGTSCGFTGTGDLQNSNPLLNALADNGGPTKTVAPLSGSPAIDAGGDAVCAAAPVNGVDQRGYARPVGAHCDIGAFEGVAVHTVTYDGNGNTEGSAPIDSNIYAQYGSVIVASNTGYLAKLGYRFVGWNTEANGTGSDYPAAAVLTMGASNVTLYAKYVVAPPAIITVTANASDTLDGADGQCSLREAITNINNGASIYADCAPTGGVYGDNDTISIPAGTYNTTIAGPGEDANATGDYDILKFWFQNKSVAIVGAGAGSTTINGNGLDRVFDIDPLGTGGVVVSISGVTIAGGGADYTNGGGIQNDGTLFVNNSVITGNTATWNHGGGNAGHGGGIVNTGTLLVSNSTISNNSDVVAGGGIHSAGAITVTNCTFSGNETQGSGGALYHSTATAAVVTNSTISNNLAWYIGANTGGIFNDGGTLTITNSTITGNRIEGAWWSTNAGLGNNAGTTYLSNTIVANQTSGTDCWNYTGGGGGPIISNGHNLESGTSCGFTGTGDLQNADPLLGALADNGGPTRTVALLSGSPAIDAGSCVQATDQRGMVRPQGSACDIGAYERAPAEVSITKTDGATTAVPGTPVTYTIVATNAGPSNAPSVTVADSFPGTCTGASWTCAGAGGGICALSGSGDISDAANLPAGGSATYTATCTTSASATGSLSNTATASVGGGVTDPTPGNNSATDTDTLTPQADVSVALIDAPDPVVGLGTLTYTIDVASGGPSSASAVSVVHTLPAGATFSSLTAVGWSCSAGTGTVTCTRPSLAPGATATFFVEVTVGPAGGTLTSDVTVSATETDPNAGNNSASEQTTVNGVPYADLSVALTDGGVTVLWGRPLTYTLTVTNGGPDAVTGATVSDSFPAGLAAISWTCTPSSGSSCAATGSGNINDTTVTLPSGGTATYSATGVVVYGTASPLVDTATVSSSIHDPVAANNSATVNTPVDVDLIFRDGFEGSP